MRLNRVQNPILLWTCTAIFFHVALVRATTVEVDNFIDSLASSSDCGTNSGLCNLRSAWEYCNAQSGAPCLINLPADTEHTIDLEYGQLELQSDANVEIVGNGATVTLSATRRLTAVTSHQQLREQTSPVFNHSNRMQIAAASDFPFTMSDFTDSNNALDVFETACVQACRFDELVFDACGGDTTLDTYFRLFRGDTQVASNDDSCGYTSRITYTVPSERQCEEYCLHMGCYGDDPCGTTVTFTHITYSDRLQSTTTTRLFYAQNTDPADVSSLTLRGLTVNAFGDYTLNGGAIYVEGQVQLLVDSCIFSATKGYVGGALYISNTTQDVQITNTRFDGCFARQAGAIYIGSKVSNARVSGCTFFACKSSGQGGGIYIDRANSDIDIASSIFTSCTAANGAGIAIDSNNENIRVTDCKFRSCYAQRDGGGVLISANNDAVLVEHTFFYDCKGGWSGGGISVLSFNEHIQLLNVTMKMCSAQLRGGGLYMGYDNDFGSVEDTLFLTCTSATTSGGILLDSFNDYFSVTSSQFVDCRAYWGGALTLLYYNHFNMLTDSTFERCRSGLIGAAYYAQTDNTDLAIANVAVTECTSSYFAAGLAIMQGNARARIENVSVTDCIAAWKGGGMLLLTTNINVTMTNMNVTRCRGSKGGGMLIDTGNTGLIMRNLQVIDCLAAAHAGGIYIGRANHQATLRDSSITGCRALSTGGDGGCLYVDTQNQDVVLERVKLSGCSARNGGGLYAEVNYNLLLRDVEISGCDALGSGGGINLHGASAVTTIVRAKIMHNQAMISGGGIFSGRQSEELTVASSEITSNSATNGGGIYVEIGNPHFSVLDARTYNARVVLESAHPYEYIQTTHNVYVDGATGYYVYFSTQTRTATQDRLSISSSNYLYSDSNTGYWPGINIPAVLVKETPFTVAFECYQDAYNAPVTAAQGYYGYRLIVIPIFPEAEGPSNISFNGATAAGGGVYFFSGVNYPVMMHAVVESNSADDGGGMYLRNAVIGMILYGSVFDANRAILGHGGAVTVSSACQALQFVRCSFTNNHALGSGGAVAFITNNGNPGGLEEDTENHIRECTFDGNNGTTSGGALFLDLNNTLLVTGSTFTNGYTSGDGGAVATSQGNNVEVNGGAIRSNAALGCGGGIAEGMYSELLLEDMEVSDNYAGQFGGGICMRTDSSMTYIRSHLRSNTAVVGGGGVACFGSRLPYSGDCEHTNNTAARGSAFYFNQLNQQLSADIGVVSVTSNAAVAGTVYWVAGSMGEPDGLNTMTYAGNTVEYGSRKAATQAVRMHHASHVTVEAYGSFLDQPIEIRLTDYYGEYVQANSPAKVYVNILNPSIDQCSGRFPFLSGADVSADGVAFVHGVATLASIDVSCNPGGQVTLLITAALEDLALDMPEAQRTMEGTIELSFRNCVAGEIIINGKCVACPAGSYSLETDVTVSTTCTECISLGSVDSCNADQIFLADSYWRRYPTSEAILPCLDELSGCAGGNHTGDASCVLGYEGPLCSICSDGYYRSDQKCILCVDTGHMSPAAVFFSAVGAAGVVAILIFVLYKLQSKGGIAAVFFIVMANVGTWFKKEARDMKVQLKILTTTFQICSTIPVAMKVAYPPQFARYLSAMTVFNLNIMAVVPVDCAHSGEYNFIDKLVMITLAPIGLSLLLLLGCTAEYSYRSMAYKKLHTAQISQEVLDAQEKKLSKVVSRYLTVFFLLTYLVLPFIATTIFRTFLCTDLDPDNEDSDADDLYLTADMRISCTSDYYKSGVGYAAVMILVYVVGIPLMYLILLFRSRKEIMERFQPLEQPSQAADEEGAKIESMVYPAVVEHESAVSKNDADESEPPAESSKASGPVNQLQLRHDHAARSAVMISFLYEAYEPQYWYWEVVETTRRLMLTAVLSVCGAGTSGQALFAVLLSLMYIKLYGFYAPYTKVSDDVLAETGQFQIFLSFLGALVYQRHLLGDEWNNTVGIILILINTTVLALFVYFACTNLYNEAKHADISQLSVRAGDDLVKPAAVVEISAVGDSSNRKDPRKVYIAVNDKEIELIPQQGGGGAEGDRTENRKEKGGGVDGGEAVGDEVVSFVNLRE